MINATVIADSICDNSKRLITFSLTYPRFILAELNTHRMLSRNSASSRAIPTHKLLKEIQEKPAAPVHWGKNQPGMQADEELDSLDKIEAACHWHQAMVSAVKSALAMQRLGVHKQIVNRIVEPFMHARTVLSGTEWDNFYTLRRHKDAQPEIKALADAMWEAQLKSRPVYVPDGQWHKPYASDPSHTLATSVACSARVSYKTHENKTSTPEQDKKLATRLLESGHWSPFEHQATPSISKDKRSFNFYGWKQLREVLSDDPNYPIC